jgi:hypothetical protein
MRARWWALLAVAAALVLGRLAAGFYVEYRWFAALGDAALGVWRARTADLLLLRGLGTLVAAAFAFANLYGVRSSVASLILPRRLGNLEIGEEVSGRRLGLVAAGVAAVIGLALGTLLDGWTAVELLRAGGPYTLPEPYTGHDLAFFIHWLPLEHELYTWSLVALVAVASIVLVLYALTASLRWERGRVRMTGHVRRHLALLGALVVLLLAWGHRLDAYDLLSAGSGSGGAFTPLDRAVGLPSRFALATLTALASLVVLRASWLGQARVTFWAVTAVLASALVFRRSSPPSPPAARGRPTARGRRPPTRRIARRSRSSRTTSWTCGARRRRTGCARRVTSRTPRPCGTRRCSRPSSSAAAATEPPSPRSDGSRWPDDSPRVGVARPGEPTRGGRSTAAAPWQVVAIDASAAGGGREPRAVGQSPRVGPRARGGRRAPGGLPGRGVARRDRRLRGHDRGGPGAQRRGASRARVAPARLPAGIRGRDRPLPAPRDRAAARRRRAARALAPFFARSHAVTPVLASDSLYWVVHLYSASERFPLSQHYSVAGVERSYFRHAAVAAVNAHTGRVTLVAAPEPDPIAAAWVRRFPRLFTRPSALPPGLASALPPETDGVVVQAWVLAQFGARAELGLGAATLPSGAGSDTTLGVTARALALLPASASPAPLRSRRGRCRCWPRRPGPPACSSRSAGRRRAPCGCPRRAWSRAGAT